DKLKLYLSFPLITQMQPLSRFSQLKLLGNPKRLGILRYLMKQPATLSQLGAHFNQSAAHIRHHIKSLEQAGLVALTDPPPEHNHLEKYYKASSEAWIIQLAVLPEPNEDTATLVIASKDHATRHLIEDLRQKHAGLTLQVLPLNSLDGLVTLRQGICQMATCHLKEPDSGLYNRSFVRHLFPGQPMAIIPMYQREEGFIVQPGNPHGIRALADLARADVRFINREHGSGIRLWLDQALKDEEISTEMVNGYLNYVSSHSEVAQAIQQGQADAGLGIAAAARSIGLDFVPLFEEPYELVLPAGLIVNPQYTPFFDHLNSGEFRTTAQTLDGYLVPPTSGQLNWVS
ncbi:MAG TPA: substrate-binding domain-containing protein, partial [Anaerolineales bacterium]|nr:substrate-binding domain-containing protein [Anaerolineales bacterium]